MATVKEITVSAGRTFNHPYESYSNLKPFVSVTATLDDGEDFVAVTKQLQAQAEELVEDHKTNMLNSLRELQDLSEKNAEARRLSATIESAQRKLNRLRETTPSLPSPREEDIEEADDDYEQPF
jgi:2-oxo-4-hydroxy-4-carboxy--5-ureidoimidazoline (OHCU) decarboxylase